MAYSLSENTTNEVSGFRSLNTQIITDMRRTKSLINANTVTNNTQSEQISGNTQVNTTQTSAISTLQSTVQTLATKASVSELSGTVQQHDSILTNKAEVSAVTEILSTIDDINENIDDLQGTVGDLETEVQNKVNSSAYTTAMNSINTSLGTKVESTTLSGIISNINSSLDSKADASAMTASNQALTNIQQTVANKVDSDIVTITNSELNAVLTRLNALEDKVSELTKSNVTLLDNTEEIVSGINNPDTYVVVTGEIKPLTETSASTPVNLTAKSIELDNITITNNVRVSINSNNVTICDSTIEGEFPRKNGGKAITSVNNANNVSITNTDVNNSGTTNYNAFEIGLSSTNLPKNVLIDNCNFNGKLTNNAILVFGTQNDATITISNCYFEDISNGLRISNSTNATGVTINIVNCTVGRWESNADYAGFLLFEDYTSQTPEETSTNNLFGDGKITVNFTNLIYNGQKITKDYTGQIYYVYGDKVGLIRNLDAQPIVNIF